MPPNATLQIIDFGSIFQVGLIVYEYSAGNFVPGHIKTSPDTWTDVFLGSKYMLRIKAETSKRLLS